ncbi:DUF6252 family protein [Flavobacterium aciduliphilum]|uniref:Lipoprotein n=1 Tax=Flavobacterium aciduliphilum TaxID=1101402 RepID=A0A328YG02_9FLAO|nr:DUF6252 family protein [Flavobacterium aciduliphilum]RAR72530.1 hypothetical protein CLV55_10597 [Flavobacterium aciduliphilum]
MKKIIYFLLAVGVFTSCQKDVQFNNPGFQAYRDGSLFRGIDIKAYKSISSGELNLVALAQDESVHLNVASASLGTYYLGSTDLTTTAEYDSSFNGVNLTYQTNVITGPVAKMYPTMSTGGSGYVSDCILTDPVNLTYACNNSHQTTGGSGSGLTLSVIANTSGVVTSVKVASPGNGYKAGDIITIVGGGNDAKVKVLNVEGSNGEIVITENTGDTVTGTFKFNAINTTANPLGNTMVNFQYGNFYKIPIITTP